MRFMVGARQICCGAPVSEPARHPGALLLTFCGRAPAAFTARECRLRDEHAWRDGSRWQVWTALLTYVLLRFCAWISRWGHSFTRLFTLLRSALWLKLDLRSFLESYGTAGGSFRFPGTPEQACLPGISSCYGTAESQKGTQRTLKSLTSFSPSPVLSLGK